MGILALFLAGPLWGIWIVKGNLAASMTLDVLPLTDPHVLLQSMLSGVTPETSALIGVAIVLLFYISVGGPGCVAGWASGVPPRFPAIPAIGCLP